MYRLRIANNGSRKTGGAATLAGSVDADWRNLLDKLEQLTLGGTGIAQKQQVNVPTPRQTVWQTENYCL